MEKTIRDGKVAVLISKGFGSGWYSCNKDYKELLFHPKLISMVEQNRENEIDRDWVLENLGIEIFATGADGLSIEWLPIGTAFCIEEHAGCESLQIIDEITLIA